MKKELWVDLRPWRKELATAALESGADAVVVESAGEMQKLGRIRTIARDGDLKPGRDVYEISITDKKGEQEAASRGGNAYVIVSTANWTVIPLENLVALSDQIIATVHTREEADLVLSVLEKGVRGVLLQTDRPERVRELAASMRAIPASVPLIPFTITEIRAVGMGDRICVDTCSMLNDGQGLLVGDTSAGFLLVHAETLVNPYVAPRPFRVNAGAAHAYTLLASGKTAYLSEISSGDRVLVVDEKGSGAEAVVGRVKIERRPLLRIQAEAGDARVSLIVQNAETIRMVRPDGIAVSVVELKVGDQVLGHAAQSGRHFGIAVKETIIEK